MRLLFDENLSPRLMELLKFDFPDSQHIRNLGMKSATDSEIWEYAITHKFTIVSKDADYRRWADFLHYRAQPQLLHDNAAGVHELLVVH